MPSRVCLTALNWRDVRLNSRMNCGFGNTRLARRCAWRLRSARPKVAAYSHSSASSGTSNRPWNVLISNKCTTTILPIHDQSWLSLAIAHAAVGEPSG